MVVYSTREDLMLKNKVGTGGPVSIDVDGRNYRRKPVNVGMFFSDLKPFSKQKPLRANLHDIGFGGARISTSQPLKKGGWIHPITYDDSVKQNGSSHLLKKAWNDKAKVVWEKIEDKTRAGNPVRPITPTAWNSQTIEKRF